MLQLGNSLLLITVFVSPKLLPFVLCCTMQRSPKLRSIGESTVKLSKKNLIRKEITKGYYKAIVLYLSIPMVIAAPEIKNKSSTIHIITLKFLFVIQYDYW